MMAMSRSPGSLRSFNHLLAFRAHADDRKRSAIHMRQAATALEGRSYLVRLGPVDGLRSVDGLSVDPGAGEIDGVFDVAVGMQGLGKAREARYRLSPALDREHLGAAP